MNLEFRDNRDQWKRKRKWLVSQLKPMAKPLAVFAASDEQALEVLESCESAGIMVPEEVAIVGAENNLLAQDAMLTPISAWTQIWERWVTCRGGHAGRFDEWKAGPGKTGSRAGHRRDYAARAAICWRSNTRAWPTAFVSFWNTPASQSA